MREIILYGSYARGDFHPDSDIDIMILLDLSDIDIKEYRHQLSDMTFDFNMDYDVDISQSLKVKNIIVNGLTIIRSTLM